MISLLRRLGRKSLALPAGLIVCLLPAALHAETITIKNGTAVVVIVQATSIDGKNKFHRDPPAKVTPGNSAATMLPGNKQITIVDPGNPNTILFQQVIPAGTEDLYFKLVIEGKPPNQKMALEQVQAPKKP